MTELNQRILNCNENHPANFRLCAERMKYLKSTRVRRKQNEEVQKSVKATMPNKVDGRAWNKNAGEDFEISTLSPLHTTHDQARTDILAILSTIKSIKSQFVLCNTMVDKVILILKHLGLKIVVFRKSDGIRTKITEF